MVFSKRKCGILKWFIFRIYHSTVVVQVHVGVVKGRYILQVTISGYINPFQRCAGCASLSRCCDTNFNTNSCFGNRRCDTFFFFCLRPIDSNVRNGTGCSYSGNLTSEVNENDATINFDQTTFLGLDNPLTLEGLTDAWNVSGPDVSLYTCMHLL